MRGLAAPWPLEVDLQATAQGQGEHSPVCLRQRLGNARAEGSPCQIQLQTRVEGTLDALQVQANGSGEGLQLTADATVHPTEAFPLGKTRLDLALPGDASLNLQVDPQAPAADGSRTVQTRLIARHLQPGPWLPKALGTTLLNLEAGLQVNLTASRQLRDLALQLDLNGPNRWNGVPLSGHVKVARLARAQGVLFDPAAPASWDPLGLVVSGLDVTLALGADRIEGRGDLAAAASRLSLQARLPALKALWPGLPGGGTLSLESQGSLARHQGEVKLHYTPADPQPGVPGRAPLALDVAVTGGWSAGQGWRGSVTRMEVQHAGLAVHSGGAIPVSIAPTGAWQVGHAAIAASLKGESLLQVDLQSAGGSSGQWATRGAIPSLIVTPERVLKIQQWLGQNAQTSSVRTALSDRARRSRLDARVDWNLTFKDALSGDIHLARTSGDLTVPGDVPITLGLQAASLDLAIRPVRGGTSLARADLQIRTTKMGSLRVQADTPLHATPAGGIVLRPGDVKHVQVQADSDDLAWANLLLDGSVEIGGTVHADVRGQSRADGRWTFSGPVRGENLSILSVDQGIRLLQGTLAAHLDGSNVVLDSLRFPAVRRVTPKEWRTATWISESPDAQNGTLDLSGNWDLYQQQGQVKTAFHRYPILQRADRYAMISGNIAIQATLPKIDVTGKIVADAGWFDLDMLNNIPSLDSDVVVLQPGKPAAPEPATPLDLSVDLNVDLGPRFYLTGYGVNSGLIGNMDLRMRQGKLTALGALRTRGGSIDVYGQHLQLRRGTVTFQGDITNPVLSIEALRTGVAVQAGVRVAGTARRPRIDLVSYPDVSETEKLTWLILGHGPDEGGGDVSLLFSVGSSFLSGGEPFYKRFGLDELSLRSGELGSTGSILPVQSVVTDLDTGASPAEQRFAVASKTLTDDLKVSLEQALAQTGTVARLSYRVVRRVQAEVTVGTVSGLALVYRWFSMD
ncbi:Translocation and assembly module TamB OS=Castellaniella defragrans OX=75697 GN=HNR28_001379 PE=4 SV=1 [Castellaniella defragrans]